MRNNNERTREGKQEKPVLLHRVAKTYRRRKSAFSRKVRSLQGN